MITELVIYDYSNLGNKRDGNILTKRNYLCRCHISAKWNAKCFISYHDDSDCVSWYKSEEKHNDHVKINNHGISEEFKIAKDRIYELYQAPSRIKIEFIRLFPDLAKESFPTEQNGFTCEKPTKTIAHMQLLKNSLKNKLNKIFIDYNYANQKKFSMQPMHFSNENG